MAFPLPTLLKPWLDQLKKMDWFNLRSHGITSLRFFKTSISFTTCCTRRYNSGIQRCMSSCLELRRYVWPSRSFVCILATLNRTSRSSLLFETPWRGFFETSLVWAMLFPSSWWGVVSSTPCAWLRCSCGKVIPMTLFGKASACRLCACACWLPICWFLLMVVLAISLLVFLLKWRSVEMLSLWCWQRLWLAWMQFMRDRLGTWAAPYCYR